MTDSTPFILCIEDDETSRFILNTLLLQVMNYTNAEIWADSIDFEGKIESLEEKIYDLAGEKFKYYIHYYTNFWVE